MKRIQIAKVLGAICLAGFLLAGCKPKETPPAEPRSAPKSVSVGADAPTAEPTVPANTAPPPPQNQVATSSEPGTAPANANITASDEQMAEELQAALQKYYLENVNSPTRFAAPRTLDELVKRGIIKRIPTPSPGKKIVYHPENWLITIENAN
jgi:hypothetical protein